MRKKVLLMGKSGSGKTSMRSIIFANYVARDTRRLGATLDVEHSHVRFLGNLVLNLWDCGGQESFMENYFLSQRDNIFRGVEVLIYVFDVQSKDMDSDMHYYQSCLEAILSLSPNAKIFCLVHKMDLVKESERERVLGERSDELKRLSKPLECSVFATSIWDETLYRAWSSIVYLLIPNIKQLEKNLGRFALNMEADEVLLFERATFLVIASCTRAKFKDANRFEKISNIVKQFKLSCSRYGCKFGGFEISMFGRSTYLKPFTPTTFILVVTLWEPTSCITSAMVNLNINAARLFFEQVELDNHRRSADKRRADREAKERRQEALDQAEVSVPDPTDANVLQLVAEENGSFRSFVGTDGSLILTEEQQSLFGTKQKPPKPAMDKPYPKLYDDLHLKVEEVAELNRVRVESYKKSQEDIRSAGGTPPASVPPIAVGDAPAPAGEDAQGDTEEGAVGGAPRGAVGGAPGGASRMGEVEATLARANLGGGATGTAMPGSI